MTKLPKSVLLSIAVLIVVYLTALFYAPEFVLFMTALFSVVAAGIRIIMYLTDV